jgi:RNA polymerase sigma-70 factor (ECF subfamily)
MIDDDCSRPPLPDLERFRPYLTLMARMHLGQKLRSKVSASDVVQQTFLEACRAPERFHERRVPQQIALLRKMLASNLAKAGRDLRRQKRDVERERSLELEIMRSSVRLVSCLVAREPSPSQRAMRHEQLVLVAAALERLPAPQRDAIVLHFLGGLSPREIAARLGRTPAAVAGLLQRGLKGLRSVVVPPG